jgi:hypothetical protein
MFGISARRFRRDRHDEEARLESLAEQLHWHSAAIPAAVVHRRVAYGLAVVLVAFALGFGLLAALPAINVGWDFQAQVRTGRGYGFVPLWVHFAFSAGISMLMLLAAAGSLIGAQAAVSSAHNRLIRFRIQHEADLPALEPRAADLRRSEALLTEQVRAERRRDRRA